MRKKKFHMRLLVLIVAVLSTTSCLDFTIIYRINEKGKVATTVIVESFDEYADYMIEKFRKSMEDDGYIIAKDNGSKVEGVSYSDMSKLFKIDMEDIRQILTPLRNTLRNSALILSRKQKMER